MSQMFHKMMESLLNYVTHKATILMGIDLIYQHKKVILQITHITYSIKIIRNFTKYKWPVKSIVS